MGIRYFWLLQVWCSILAV